MEKKKKSGEREAALLLDGALTNDVTGWRGSEGEDSYQFYGTTLHNSSFIIEIFVRISIYQQFPGPRRLLRLLRSFKSETLYSVDFVFLCR